MTDHTNIIKEITELTMRIKREHPELYARLEETPTTLNADFGDSAENELLDYLQTLQEMLEKKEQAQGA
jgi:hypothetical protein